ncbi:DNA gyrase inhibitor YacG [Sphingomonas sp. M1-B02]|uniref:DNA gyrase inhibitor YacG n=1 Tax=Sphingomonas sp. M1-B02 TaxID=3114300 RepID=UPI002240C9DE|nr:DNA gyrase inhibitor YacG [Sphingomonas sp. S6-11]UZK64762.1 DNA gyrase inhibitor YacG [Sphingomonas sp. S6-11]
MKRDTCPLCSEPTNPEYTPFCSRGCKDRDLLNWLGEGYRVPAESVDPEALSALDSAADRD